jgi:hypothetical protein
MAKDVIVSSKTHPKIKGFSTVMTAVSSITTYFSHSNYGQFWLWKELDKEGDKHGVEVAGAARFSSFSTNAKSVACCFDSMQCTYTSGHLKFDSQVVSFYSI